LFGFSPNGWTMTGMASVNNLEDVIGGHVWVGILCIAGGIFHMVSQPLDWAKRALIWSGEAYLSYSLGALAIAGFSVACFVSVNDIVYPSVFYGAVGAVTDSTRATLASVHAGLGFLALMGHLWHAYRVRATQRGLQFATFFDFMAKDVTLTIPASLQIQQFE
jgi:photosystem II CP43 chlorophyll apoprotein